MKKRINQLYAGASSAARMLDLSISEFLRLVELGFLPSPTWIEKHKRWAVSELSNIKTAASYEEAFEW